MKNIIILFLATALLFGCRPSGYFKEPILDWDLTMQDILQKEKNAFIDSVVHGDIYRTDYPHFLSTDTPRQVLDASARRYLVFKGDGKPVIQITYSFHLSNVQAEQKLIAVRLDFLENENLKNSINKFIIRKYGKYYEEDSRWGKGVSPEGVNHLFNSGLRWNLRKKNVFYSAYDNSVAYYPPS